MSTIELWVTIFCASFTTLYAVALLLCWSFRPRELVRHLCLFEWYRIFTIVSYGLFAAVFIYLGWWWMLGLLIGSYCVKALLAIWAVVQNMKIY